MLANLQLKEQVTAFARQYRGGVVVAVSGGCDSMALLELLTQVRAEVEFALAVLHVNFGLRGAEADGDQHHVQAAAQARGLACHVHRVNAADLAQRRGRSEQEWARLLRQRELRHYCAAHDCIAALAHHRDDLAETALYRLIRGADVAQLPGMVEFDAPFWRPLLTFSKECLRSLCEQRGVAYRTDSSNRKNIYARNRMRNLIMPQLMALHRDAPMHLITACQQAQALQAEVERELRAEWQVELQRGALQAAVLREMPVCKAKILLRLLLGRVTQRTVTEVLAKVGREEKFTRQLRRDCYVDYDGEKLQLRRCATGVKVARTQQYMQIVQQQRLGFVLESGAYAETKDVSCRRAANAPERSVSYRLYRPTQREKVPWQGKSVLLRRVRHELPTTLYVREDDRGERVLVDGKGECLVC